MPIEITKTDKRCRVVIEGELTIYQMANYHKKLLAECENVTQLTVDLSRVSELDTAGVQLLLALVKQIQTLGGELSTTPLSEAATRALQICNLLGRFPVDAEVR